LSTPGPKTPGHSSWAKLSLAAGAVACVLPLPLFGLKLPLLGAFEQNVLTGLFIASMLLSSLIGYRRPLLGMLVVPCFFFGLTALVCWHFASLRP
jgi:hypothetical protein